MELYFIRHGIAVDRMDKKVASDEERWLTDEGIKKMETAAKGFTKIVTALDHIFSSPLVRAQQTAKIVSKAFKKSPSITIDEGLSPGVTFETIERLTQDFSHNASLAFVGHEPDMSRLISILITGSDQSWFEMKKGAIGCIGVEGKPIPGSGILLWLMQPKHLRKVTQ